MPENNQLPEGLKHDAEQLGHDLQGVAAEAEHAVGEAAHGHGEAHESHPPEPPTFISVWHETHPSELSKTLFVGNLDHPMPIFNKAPWGGHVFLLIAAVVTILIAMMSTRQFRSDKRASMKNPSRGQVFIEWVVDSMDKFVCGILGPVHGRAYLPFIGTLFVLILISNLLGMVPLMAPPTASYVVTLSLALCTFVYVQFTAFTKLGLGKFLFHLAGEPKDTIGYVLAPLFFVLEVIGVIAKPISLSLRLFGNMLGKDILLGAFTMMGIMLVGAVSKDLANYVGVPLTIPFYFLGILLSAIQALVFSILSAIYILLVLPHDHHGHDEDHGHGHDHGHGAHGVAHAH